jgi:hypothetical protein
MHLEPIGSPPENPRPPAPFGPRRVIRLASWTFLVMACQGCDPAAQRASSGSSDEGTSESVLSASRVYGEFNENPIDAAARYQGKTVELEGLVSEIVPLDGGDAAVHLADGGQRIAIATFPRQDDLRGVRVGETMHLRCAFDRYEFKTVWLSFCTRPGAPTAGSGPEDGGNQVPSANLLYREYVADARSAGARYDGNPVELEARRGDVIELSSGGAAVHIADDGKRNAVVAAFRDASAVAGIGPGELFRLRCRVEKFEYLILWLEACEIAQ